jgi:hypothetical protein
VKKALLFVPLFALLLQGCGATMTPYEPNFDNVQTLKQHAPLQPVTPAQVTAAPGQGSMFVRMNPISSPSGSIAGHVQDALNGELTRAGLVNPQAQRHLNVLVTQSNLTAGIVTGTGTLAARFTLLDGPTVKYDATKTVSSEWSSSFLGVIAIANAANAYNPLVRDLLKSLYSDPLFIQALAQQ